MVDTPLLQKFFNEEVERSAVQWAPGRPLKDAHLVDTFPDRIVLFDDILALPDILICTFHCACEKYCLRLEADILIPLTVWLGQFLCLSCLCTYSGVPLPHYVRQVAPTSDCLLTGILW